MKKIIGFLLTICLVFTSAIPAFAEVTEESKNLEKAILQVKSITVIPKDYKNFQYSSSTYEQNGKKISVWYMNWNNDDSSGGISATCEDGGYLINFNKYSNTGKDGLGTVNRENGQKKAEAFLSKARPDVASNLKLMDNTAYSNSDRHYYNYKVYKNDAIVGYLDISVEVDKFTGEVVGYYYTGSDEDFKNLPDAVGVIGLEAAQKAYLDKINVSLSYYSYYDYNKKTLNVFPAYYGVNTAGKAIDAKTGEAVPLYNDYRYYRDMGGAGGMNKMSEASAVKDELTKEELEAVEGISALITKEKAESILRSTIPGLASGTKVLNSTLSKHYAEKDKYQWEIGFDGAYGVVNAKTGELISFYVYNVENSKKNTGISEEKAKEKAEAFMKSVAPDKFKQSRFYESPAYQIYKSDPNVTDYSFNYYRQVNGIDFVGNGFTVIVNKESGMITHYDCSWYDVVNFPSIDNAISEEEAFRIINETGKMGLMYKKVNAGEAALVYDFTYSAGDFLIDPSNGDKLGWDGKAYKDKAVPEYVDIKGHWAETKIMKLLENGYYIQGEKFNPGQKINQLNFLRYLYSPIQMYYDDDEFYKMLINDKIIKDGEKAPTAILTRQDAAKYVVRFLGQGKSAEHPEIFINPFKDKVTESYRGYAAICYGLKVMQGDNKGRFNGTKQVTNAEAAVIIFNALQVK